MQWNYSFDHLHLNIKVTNNKQNKNDIINDKYKEKTLIRFCVHDICIL
jgi:hypothetical protein